MSLRLHPNRLLCGNNRLRDLLLTAASSCLTILQISGLSESAIASPVSLDGSTPLSALSSSDCGAVDCTITSSMTGDHYFHSFDTFNIDEGVTVTFDAPGGVKRIFGRLGRSNPGGIRNEVRIGGTLAVSGSADLFLLSSDGIQILPTGQIVSGGSFIGTTARSLEFAEGSFLTGTTAAPPTLSSSSIPLGLRFVNGNRDIEVEGDDSNSLWQSQNSGTFALIGGNIGEVFVEERTIDVAQGGLVIAAVGPVNYLPITALPTSYTFDFSAVSPEDSGIVKLEEVNITPATSHSAGNIDLYGRRIRLEESEIKLETAPGITNSGNISIAGETLILSDGSYLGTKTTALTGGNITIDTLRINLMDSDDDNDIIVEAPTNRLSLSSTPQSSNSDPSQFGRDNEQNDVGYRPWSVMLPPAASPPVPPPSVAPPAPPPTTPEDGGIATPLPTIVVAEPGELAAEPTDEVAPAASSPPAADSLPASLSLWQSLKLNEEEEQQVALSASAQSRPSAIASLCQASHADALLTASGRGGVAAFPQQLVGQTSLADLGTMDSSGHHRRALDDERSRLRTSRLVLRSSMLQDSAAGEAASNASTTQAVQERLWRQTGHAEAPVEAIRWQRSQQGQLQLVAQSHAPQLPEFSVSCGKS